MTISLTTHSNSTFSQFWQETSPIAVLVIYSIQWDRLPLGYQIPFQRLCLVRFFWSSFVILVKVVRKKMALGGGQHQGGRQRQGSAQYQVSHQDWSGGQGWYEAACVCLLRAIWCSAVSASCLPLSAGHTIAHRDASLAMHFPKIRNTKKHKIRNTTEEVKENAKNQSMEYTNMNDKYATYVYSHRSSCLADYHFPQIRITKYKTQNNKYNSQSKEYNLLSSNYIEKYTIAQIPDWLMNHKLKQCCRKTFEVPRIAQDWIWPS